MAANVDPSLKALLPDVAAGLLHSAPGRFGLPVAGICGAQGSGKTTLAQALEAELAAQGMRALMLSLDDFYLPKTERLALAQDVHPLCATRGVPGTHDMALFADVLRGLAAAAPDTETPVPQFSKLDDDRVPFADWPRISGRPDIVLFEGWCVGASPLAASALEAPANALEASEDADGVWRRWWNGCLDRDYWPLWQDLAPLILIRVPGLESVVQSRLVQEAGLAAAEPLKPRMDEAAVRRFVAHYERLTRHIWAEMPARAHLVLDRDDGFSFSISAPISN
ncbi:hypothetical protein [Pyruvatibacter mobilis]|uniref:hypothetical protein n=1 Tax=Pyruvatibacter mobilis TaxID=1712261 RepID=UPI003D0F9CAD